MHPVVTGGGMAEMVNEGPEVGLKDGVVIEVSERNAEICRLYTGGLTLQQVGDHYGLTKERVRQILREAGVYKTDRKKETKVVRDAFLGINITEGDKVALCQEAARRGVSMSQLTADLIRKMLSELPSASSI